MEAIEIGTSAEAVRPHAAEFDVIANIDVRWQLDAPGHLIARITGLSGCRDRNGDRVLSCRSATGISLGAG